MRRWPERLALVVGGPLVLFGLLEGGFWLLGVADEPSVAAAIEYPFDPEALRGRLRATGERPLVLCLGDSSLAGYPLDLNVATDAGFSACDQVAAALGLPAVNVAQGGLSLRHVADRAEVACERRLPPGSLVLLYAGHNEFLNLPRAPPVVRTLSRLRTFRLLRRWLGPSTGGTEGLAFAGEALTDRDDVLAATEVALRRLVTACRAQPLVVSTLVGNPDFHVPELPELTDGGETLRDYLRRGGQAGPSRELLIAPPEVDAAIVRVTSEAGVPLLDAAPLAHGDSMALFLDWVHPTGELHRRLAAGFLETARRAGLVGASRAPVVGVAPGRLQWALERAAVVNVKLDPRFALAQLRTLTAPQDVIRVGLARLVAGFLLDAPGDVAAGVALVSGRREALARCLAPGAAEACLPWPSRAVLSAAERAELVAQLKDRAPPELVRFLERF